LVQRGVWRPSDSTRSVPRPHATSAPTARSNHGSRLECRARAAFTHLAPRPAGSRRVHSQHPWGNCWGSCWGSCCCQHPRGSRCRRRQRRRPPPLSSWECRTLGLAGHQGRRCCRARTVPWPAGVWQAGRVLGLRKPPQHSPSCRPGRPIESWRHHHQIWWASVQQFSVHNQQHAAPHQLRWHGVHGAAMLPAQQGEGAGAGVALLP
jgi:hypothetical protein